MALAGHLPQPVLASPAAVKGRAFTLLEMMIVLTIVAILATLLLPVYGHLRERAEGAVHGEPA